MSDTSILWSLRPSQLTFVLELIGQSNDAAWVQRTLKPFLSHKSRVVREGAIYGISNHMNDEMRGVLKAISASDPSEGVRRAAADAIEQ